MAWLYNVVGRLRYAFNDSHADKDYGWYLSRVRCRWNGHKAGVWF